MPPIVDILPPSKDSTNNMKINNATIIKHSSQINGSSWMKVAT